jgi:hypothetical protein
MPRGCTYVTPGRLRQSRCLAYSSWLHPFYAVHSSPDPIASLVRTSTMPRPLSSSSIVPLPLMLLLLVQLSVRPVTAQIQAPSCLPAALGVWNWVRIS